MAQHKLGITPMSKPVPPVAASAKPLVKARLRSRATGRVTLADVAAIAGVSPITASRVVSGKMNVDSELAARVRSAVDRSEERRGGKEWVRTGRSRRSPYH